MRRKFKYIFLDRDGVINEERPSDYVKDASEFIFIDGSIEAISILSNFFEKIFIVTNQRGIGRQIMTCSDLNNIHQHMISQIETGRIDDIFYCTDLSSTSVNRKPNVGMAFQALEKYPSLTFEKSIMVGNSKSDIQFGKKLGMYTVLVGDKYPKTDNIYQIVDDFYENLLSFVKSLQNNSNE